MTIKNNCLSIWLKLQSIFSFNVTHPVLASSCLQNRNFWKRQNFENMCSNLAPLLASPQGFSSCLDRSGDGVEQTALRGVFWKTLQLSLWLCGCTRMQPYTWTMLLLMASAGVALDFATERPDTINFSQFLPVSSCVIVVLGDSLWACCACHASSTANACSPRLSICFMPHAHHSGDLTLSSGLNKEMRECVRIPWKGIVTESRVCLELTCESVSVSLYYRYVKL